jgi:hypothetical protein
VLSAPAAGPRPRNTTQCRVPQGTECGANRAHVTRPRSRAWTSGRPGQRPRDPGRSKRARFVWPWNPGPGPKAEQRLSRCMALSLRQNSKSAIKLLQMVLATPHYSPNAKTPRFGIRNHPKHTTHELLASCGKFAGVVWEVAWLLLRETRMGPQHRQNGGQRRERPLGRSWWSLPWHVASSGRALLPAVRHPTNMCRNAKHSFTPLTSLRF